MEKIKFSFADGEDAAEFFVLEQTRISGVNYILVADSEEDDGECIDPEGSFQRRGGRGPVRDRG